jgi:hypothetical protein
MPTPRRSPLYFLIAFVVTREVVKVAWSTDFYRRYVVSMRVEMMEFAGDHKKRTIRRQIMTVRHNLQQSVTISGHFRNSGSFPATTETNGSKFPCASPHLRVHSSRGLFLRR